MKIKKHYIQYILTFLTSMIISNKGNIQAQSAHSSSVSTLSKINEDLKQNIKTIDFFEKIHSETKSTINSKNLNLILKTANNFFKNKQYWLTIYFLEKYMSKSQISKKKQYNEIQSILFYSYLNEKQFSKSFAALQNFTTSIVKLDKNIYHQLNEHLTVFINNINHYSINKNKLKNFIVGLSKIKIPNKYLTKYINLVSLLSNHAGEIGFAKIYLKQHLNTSEKISDPKFLYSLSLIEIKNNNLDNAYEYLQEIVSLGNNENNIMDAAHLSMARINYIQNKLKLASENYLLISATSIFTQQAIHELLFLEVKRHSWKKARHYAGRYLNEFPNSIYDKKITSILPFLDIKLGRYSTAKTAINSRLKQLTHLKSKLKNKPKRHMSSDLHDIFYYKETVNDEFLSPNLLTKIISTKQLLKSVDEKISSTQSDISRMSQTFAKTRDFLIHPSIKKQYIQTLKIGQQSIESAKKISFTEENFYKISPLKKTLLQNIRKQSIQINTKQSMYALEQDSWRNINNLTKEQRNIDNLYTLSENLNAKLNTLLFLRVKNVSYMNSKFRILALKSKLKKISIKIQTIESKFQEKIYMQQGHYLINLPERQIYNSQIDSLNKEMRFFTEFRNKSENFHVQKDSTDALRSWILWRQLIAKINTHLIYLEQKSLKDIKKTHEKVTKFRLMLTMLQDKREKIQEKYKKILDSSSSYILQHYFSQILREESHLQKLLGDINWSKYDSLNLEKEYYTNIFKLRKNILKQSLINTENTFLNSRSEKL